MRVSAVIIHFYASGGDNREEQIRAAKRLQKNLRAWGYGSVFQPYCSPKCAFNECASLRIEPARCRFWDRSLTVFEQTHFDHLYALWKAICKRMKRPGHFAWGFEPAE